MVLCLCVSVGVELIDLCKVGRVRLVCFVWPASFPAHIFHYLPLHSLGQVWEQQCV